MLSDNPFEALRVKYRANFAIVLFPSHRLGLLPCHGHVISRMTQDAYRYDSKLSATQFLAQVSWTERVWYGHRPPRFSSV